MSDAPKYCVDCHHYGGSHWNDCHVLYETPTSLVHGPRRKGVCAETMRKAPGWLTRTPRCGPEGKFFEPILPKVPYGIRNSPY